jgi:hypothetical protein
VGLIMRRKTAMKRTRAANEEGIVRVLGFGFVGGILQMS